MKMEEYEGTVLQSMLTVPVSAIWIFLFLWLCAIAGLIYLGIVI